MLVVLSSMHLNLGKAFLGGKTSRSRGHPESASVLNKPADVFLVWWAESCVEHGGHTMGLL